ncbi:MAG: hypothetical protein ACLTQL_01830 [Eisenbergiella sp.]
MSNKSAGRNGSKKKAAAKSVAQSAVGTVFNVVLIVVAAMLIYSFCGFRLSVRRAHLRGAAGVGGAGHGGDGDDHGRHGF